MLEFFLHRVHKEILTVFLLSFEIQKKRAPQFSSLWANNGPASQLRKKARQRDPASQRPRGTTFSQRSKAHRPLKTAWKRTLPEATTGLETPCGEGETSREGILVGTILQSTMFSRCSHKGWAGFQQSLAGHSASSSTAVVQTGGVCNGALSRSLCLLGSPPALHQLYLGKLNLQLSIWW